MAAERKAFNREIEGPVSTLAPGTVLPLRAAFLPSDAIVIRAKD
jgi:hypothetical protein